MKPQHSPLGHIAYQDIYTTLIHRQIGKKNLLM